MIKFMNENKSDSVLIVSIERLLQSISNYTNLVLNSLGKQTNDITKMNMDKLGIFYKK